MEFISNTLKFNKLGNIFTLIFEKGVTLNM